MSLRFLGGSAESIDDMHIFDLSYVVWFKSRFQRM